MFDRSWFVPLLLGSLMACPLLIASNAKSTPAARPQAAPARLANQSPTAPIKTTTIQVEGKPQTIPIDLVQLGNVATYFPTDRFTLNRSANPSDQDKRIELLWKKPDGTLHSTASISIFFYDKPAGLRTVREIADVNASTFEHYGWRRIEQDPSVSYAKKAYSTWLRDLIRFEGKTATDLQNSAATIYLGELENQAFVALSFYSEEDKAEFKSREDIILKNLKVISGN